MGILLRITKKGTSGFKKGYKGYRKIRHHAYARPKGELKAIRQELKKTKIKIKWNRKSYARSKQKSNRRKIKRK